MEGKAGDFALADQQSLASLQKELATMPCTSGANVDPAALDARRMRSTLRPAFEFEPEAALRIDLFQRSCKPELLIQNILDHRTGWSDLVNGVALAVVGRTL